jgi:HlyD family secretion protein
MSNRRTVVIIAIVVITVITVGAYYYQSSRRAQAQQVEEPDVQTAQVQRGDLTITADGSGELVPGAEVDIGFRTGGVLTELPVDVGHPVEAGDVLARVDDADAQKAVVSAQLQLLKAQLDLASAETHLLTINEGPSDADLLAAEAALATATESYERLVSGPDSREIEKMQLSLDQAKNSLWSSQLSRDATCAEPDANRCDTAQISVLNAEISVRKAEMELEALLESATEAELSDARAKVAQSEESLEELRNAPTEDDIADAEGQLEQARLNVTQAELTLQAAREEVEQTTLVAPIHGTVMAVNAKVGEKVGSSPILTLADLESAQVLFWVEESDLAAVALGNPVNIVFEALPDWTFSGEIKSVDPALVTVSNTPAVQVWATVDLSTNPVRLLSGMNAEVEVIAAEARNVLLVPVQALRELGPDQYAVFVVKPDGEMELRPVQVGLKDFVYAEVVSGLEGGEVVRTGTTESSQSSSSSSDQAQPQRPGGLFPFPGMR